MIGADPELFVADSRTQVPTPIVGLLGGTKAEPMPMDGLADGFAYQEDNVMVEFNIPPAEGADEFVSNIRTGLGYIENLVRTSHGLAPMRAGEVLFSEDALATPQASMFGCSAEYDAYGQGVQVPVVNPDSLVDGHGAWRFAGGHVHLGYNAEGDIPPFAVAQLCDVWIGLSSVGVDPQRQRRSLYGQAGRFRPTAYGMEYRTLSNYWLWDEEAMETVATGAARVVWMVENQMDVLLAAYKQIPWPDVARAINTDDAQLARELRRFCRNLNLGGL